MPLTNIDAEELQRLIGGEKKSWDRFVTASASLIRAMVYRTIRHHTGDVDPTEAEDAVQNVYEKLLRNEKALLQKFDPKKASLSTWLGLISRSVTIDLLRKKKHHLSLNESAVTDVQAQTPVHETAIDLPKGLLSARQELILRLLFDKEMEPEEAASFLGVEVQTIRSTKHKAIEKLRQHYKEHL